MPVEKKNGEVIGEAESPLKNGDETREIVTRRGYSCHLEIATEIFTLNDDLQVPVITGL